MANHRVYVAASTQHSNIGVGAYGTEQDRMMLLADRVKYWLTTQKGKFTVFRNKPGWTLEQTKEDCNKLSCQAFVDNHSDAGKAEQKAGDGGAEGTTAFYHHQSGTSGESYRLASLIYKHVSAASPGKDRGVLPDNAYVGSLYVIQQTNPPATLVEHMFHTNYEEVADMIKDMDKYAKAEAKGICEYFGEKWEEPEPKPQTVDSLVDDMVEDGIVTDRALWIRVLSGKETPKPEHLQIAFARATTKIR